MNMSFGQFKQFYLCAQIGHRTSSIHAAKFGTAGTCASNRRSNAGLAITGGLATSKATGQLSTRTRVCIFMSCTVGCKNRVSLLTLWLAAKSIKPAK